MKKNILLVFSMLLIGAMFASMFFVAVFDENKDTTIQNQESEKQELQISIRNEPNSLHPGLANDPTSDSVIYQTFEGLSRVNLWGQTVNAAASVVKISDDLKTYTFIIRDSKWSNGDPVIAQDFEYAWKWALNPKNKSEQTNIAQLYHIKGAEAYHAGVGSEDDLGVKAINDKTLEVELVNPNPDFLDLTTLSIYFPINSKIAMQSPKWSNDVGEKYTSNGPFKLTDWEHSKKIVLKKNDNYWDKGSVKLNSITMIVESDPIEELAMFEKGELDWLGFPTKNVPTKEFEERLNKELLALPSDSGVFTLKLNTTMEPLNNKNIRKALALSINRQQIVDDILKKGHGPAMSIVAPSFFPEYEKGYFKDDDVKKAKQYLETGLKELGYQDVSEIPTISLFYSNNESNKEVVQSILNMWKKRLGIDFTMEPMELETLVKNVETENYNIVGMGWLGDYDDVSQILQVYNSDNSSNLTNRIVWKNAEFSGLLEQLKTEKEVSQRQKLLRKAEETLIEEMPVIPVYFYSNNGVQKAKVRDVAKSNLGQVQFKWAYFEEFQKDNEH